MTPVEVAARNEPIRTRICFAIVAILATNLVAFLLAHREFYEPPLRSWPSEAAASWLWGGLPLVLVLLLIVSLLVLHHKMKRNAKLSEHPRLYMARSIHRRSIPYRMTIALVIASPPLCILTGQLFLSFIALLALNPLLLAFPDRRTLENLLGCSLESAGHLDLGDLSDP